MSRNPQETRAQYLTGATAAAAATGFAQSDWARNAYLLLNVFANGGGAVTVALSSSIASGAGGTAVTSVTTAATGLSFYKLPPEKLSQFVSASSSGSAGAPVYSSSILLFDYLDSTQGATAARPVQL